MNRSCHLAHSDHSENIYGLWANLIYIQHIHNTHIDKHIHTNTIHKHKHNHMHKHTHIYSNTYAIKTHKHIYTKAYTHT